MKDTAALPPFYPGATCNALYVGDCTLDILLEKLPLLDPAAPATFLAQDVRGKPPANTPLCRYLVPSVFIWHQEEGFATHAAIDNLASALAAHLCKAIPALDGLREATRFTILDHVLYKWLLLETLEKELAERRFDKLYVVTRSEAFFSLVETMVKRQQADLPIVAIWQGIPPIVSSPLRALWPNITQRAGGLLHDVCSNLAQFLQLSTRAPVYLLAGVEHNAPAIIGWNVRDRNYVTGLKRILQSTLAERPVILFLDSDDDENVARLEAFVASLGLPPESYFKILRYSTFLARARQDLERLGVKIGLAAKAFAKKPGLSPLEQNFCQVELPTILADYAHLRAVALVAAAMDQITSICGPAYGILGSARSAAFAAIAEKLTAKGAPSMDVHTYIVGKNARQVAPPTRYVGVIDDQQETFVAGAWDMQNDDILRIGYIWRDKGGEAPPSETISAAQKTILICSQPGDPEMVEQFMANVLDVIARDSRLKGILKPHPAEPATTLNAYDAAIRQRKLTGLVQRLDTQISASSLFDQVDLVITRTSNVGIEAALRLRPTIRYIEFDRYDPGAISDVSYAANITSRPELEAAIHALIFSPEAITNHRALQMNYMRENPAQKQADGAQRIVDFLEDRSSGKGRRCVAPGRRYE